MGSSNNTLTNNTVSNNLYDIYLVSSNNNTITNNTIFNSYNYNPFQGYGINVDSSSNNSIYNNYFNNNNNVRTNNSVNSWNITKSSGTNIFGGPYLAGNFWDNPGGTDFSRTCSDDDRDGICDSSYTDMDFLPLTYIPGSATITVKASGGADYTKIQDALNNVVFRDTVILVQSGTYYERVEVTKPVILKGIDNGGGKPVINGNGWGNAIKLSIGNTTLEGFTIMNPPYGNAGINVVSNKNIIRNNTVLTNWYGIYLVSSSNNTLTNNTVSNNLYDIYLVFSNNTTITNNTVFNSYNYNPFQGYGINVDSSSNNSIYNNYFNNNNNIRTNNSVNSWNITKTPGTNIFGRPYLAGNFWAKPDGTGFSQTCADSHSDGICDNIYPLDAYNIDYLPLSMNYTLDITPPTSITNLSNMSFAQNYINWTWTDPADPDFTNVSVWIDAVFKANISKGTQFYNATGFAPDSDHTISTRTIDTNGNVNQTWVNHTARTSSSATANFENWQYYRDITINNTGGPLTDYQVLLNLSGTAFPLHANASGADIRFEQGGAELSYWIEKWNYANASALVWVKVRDVPAGMSSMRMWYGNEKAVGMNEVNSTFIRVIDGIQMSLSMDEGSGTTIYDNSGNGNNGALINGPTWVDGKFGKALSFDYVDDYISIPDTSSLRASPLITIELWNYVNPFTGYQSIALSKLNMLRGEFLSSYQMGYYRPGMGSDIKLLARLGEGPAGFSHLEPTKIITPNNWYHIIITYDQSVARIYINAVLESSINSSLPLVYDSKPVYIGRGRNANDEANFFNGLIDEVRIYNRTLSYSEISDLYNNYGHTTTNYPGRVLVRKYASPEPSVIVGTEHSKGLSNSGGGTWLYSRNITINNTGAVLTDYQILLNLTGTAFPSRANASGADLRFEQGGAELSYWIEKWDYANASALVWVNVTSVSVGESLVRMWYGNEKAAGVSEVNSTFIRAIYGNVLSLPMDEGSGTTAYDTSGKGNNGALINGLGWVNGNFGKALSFDGNNDYVDVPDSASMDITGNITIEAWAKPNKLGIHQALVDKHNYPSNYGYGIGMWLNNNNKVEVEVGNGYSGTGTSTSLTTLEEGKWYHIVFAADTVKGRIYLNGIDEPPQDQAIKVYQNAPVGVYIGKAHSTFRYIQPVVPNTFNGTIDEVRIYNRALSADEISDLYHNHGYTTANYLGRVLVRKYSSPDPSIIVGAEHSKGLSNSGGGTWQYSRNITINNTGAALTYYQILLNLTDTAFPSRANASGADIRFEQGGTELSYWIEKWDYANRSAVVWVNVTDVPVGESAVRMWYGNEKAAGLSEGNRTFIRVIYGNVMSLPMDEGSGTTIYDTSGNGNNGTMLNDPGWADGKFGNALNFDKSNDYVEISG